MNEHPKEKALLRDCAQYNYYFSSIQVKLKQSDFSALKTSIIFAQMSLLNTQQHAVMWGSK
jgi:hypothetical protein